MSVFNRKEGKKLIKDQLRLLKNKDSKDNNTKNNIKVQLETVQNLLEVFLKKINLSMILIFYTIILMNTEKQSI